MALPLEKFVKQLEDSQIVAGDTLKDFLPPKGEPKDAEELALELVRKKKLTKFQAEEISKGKGKSLTLGNYVLMEKIGAGGMGQVFKARHRVMERLVAVKVLPTAMTKDKDAIARFHREVKAAAKLRHINIVAADDADQANGVHFLVMELVEGSDLSALVKKDGPFPIEKAVNYILQAAKGLEFAHKKGVVHRDIKPANLLLESEGTVKILDMGLARIHGEPGQAELTSTGAVMGTVDYMAPEQALSTKTADARADIYSLGCSLYYLLTAKATYDGETLMAKLLAHRDQPIPSLRSVRTKVPEQLENVFNKMVAKKIEDRYQTMTDVITALEGCRSGLSNTLAIQSSEAEQTIVFRDTSVSPRTVTLPLSTRDEVAKSNTSSRSKSVESSTEAKLTDFFDNLPSATTKSLRTKKLTKKPVKKGKNTLLKDQKKLLLIGGAVLGVMILLAVVVINMRTSGGDGTLVVTVSESDAEVQVLNDKDTVEITRKGDKGLISITVVPGKHRLKIQKDGFEIFTDSFEIKSGKSESIKADLIPLKKIAAAGTSWHGWPADAPKPAIAPFDANQAKKHQEAWAGYLKIPLEYTNSIGMKFRLIPPGEFTIGSTSAEIEEALKLSGEGSVWLDCIRSEGPQHKVILTQPFYMGIHGVTQAEYEQVMRKNPSYFAKTGTDQRLVEKVAGLDTANYPVEGVGWNDAAEFCGRLSEQEKLLPFYVRSGETVKEVAGNGYRLPTDAEREFACRAGTTTRYWIGDKEEELVQAGWIGTNSDGRVHKVGELKANPFGLYDVHGNVWEWVQDWWALNTYSEFAGSPAINPTGPSTAGSQRVVRGGVFEHPASHSRASLRYAIFTTQQTYIIGFRVSLPVEAVKTAGVSGAKKPLAFETPGFEKWVKDVQAMPAEKQVEAVSNKLMELNPGFDGKVTPTIENGVVTEFEVVSDNVTDISPVRVLSGLKTLQIHGGNDFRGILTDISPLQGLRLTTLRLVGLRKLTDISPLRGMPLSMLAIKETGVSDLSPLQWMALTNLGLVNLPVSNLSPLRGMPLGSLQVSSCPVTDLSPLKESPLTALACHTSATDLSPLKQLPLKYLLCEVKPERDSEILRSIKTLEKINDKPVAEFWKEVEEQQKGKKPLAFQTPGFDQWVKEIQAMPAEKQVEAVNKKLMELNPGFDGKVGELSGHLDIRGTPRIENGVVTELMFVTAKVTDISPLRVFSGLKVLYSAADYNGILTDISPLQGIRLTKLKLFGNRRLTDLSPLKDMPLDWLDIQASSVSDLTSLTGMPLEHLNLHSCDAIADLSPLKGMPLTDLRTTSHSITDLSPLQGLKLTTFQCGSPLITNFKPLQGMPLDRLAIGFTKIDDLSILKGMPLVDLDLIGCTNIFDFSPLKEFPLKQVRFEFKSERDTELLRSIKTLEIINNKPVAEFWKEVEEQQKGKKSGQ